jgi:hypothetical protein
MLSSIRQFGCPEGGLFFRAQSPPKIFESCDDLPALWRGLQGVNEQALRRELRPAN